MPKGIKWETEEERHAAECAAKLKWHHSEKGKIKVQETLMRNPVYQLMYGLKDGHCSLCLYRKSKRAIKFHHIDPKEKLFNLSMDKALFYRPIEDVITELNKTIMVCGNCHDEIHDHMVERMLIEKYRVRIIQ